MTTTISEQRTTRPALPAVDCAPWCDDGAGHTDALFPRDQYCSTDRREVPLLRMRPIEGGLDQLGAYLIRERFEAEPFVQLTHDDDAVAQVTLKEARQYAADLLALVDLAEGVSA